MDEALMTGLIEAARQQTGAFELFFSEDTSIGVRFDKGRLQDIRQRGSSGVALRAAKNGKLGVSSSSRIEDGAELVLSAVRLAAFGRPFDFTFAPKAAAVCPERFTPALSDISPERLVNLGERMQNRLKELAPDAMYGGSLNVSWSSSRVVTSEGQDARERSSRMVVMAMAELNREGDFLGVADARVSAQAVTDAQIDACVKKAAEDFLLARKDAPVRQGAYRVLFTPNAMSDILRPLFVSVDGKNVERKVSRWVENIGQPVLDRRITVRDDPSHPEGPGSSSFDGEGTPTRPRAIVDKGVLRGFLHTRATAARTGQEPTGNASRSLGSSPACSFHNVVMEAGDAPLADMLKQASGGLYVDEMLGVFTSNFLAGQVTGNISLGYGIEDGQRIGRVKNAALNVNTFDVFGPSGAGNSMVAISREREWTGGMLLPYVLVDNVAISTRAG